jgi:class 3 adenylate cyclase
MSEFSEFNARLVGRADQLAVAGRLIEETMANGVRLLLVEGRGGIGKSRLVAEIVELARPRAAVVVSARGRRSVQAPFSSVHPLLRVNAGPGGMGPAAHELFSLSPGDGALIVTANASAERSRRLADAAATTSDSLVEQCGADSMAVVVLDDIQWFDASSQDLVAAMLDDLTDRHPQSRVLVLAATRPPEAGAPAGQLLRVLAASARARRLYLDPLSEPDEADLVRSVVAEASVPYLDLVRRSSRGNPLHTLAVVSVLRRRGIPGNVLASDPRITRGAVLAVPAPADAEGDEPLRAQLAQVGDDGADTLARMAVFGAEFSLADAADVTGRPEAELGLLFDRAVAGYLLETDGEAYWFSHDRLAEVAAAGLRPSVRLEAHRRSADRLATLRRGGTRGLEVDIGRHHLQAGDAGPTEGRRTELMEAGEACHSTGAWEDAGLFFERALSLAGGSDELRLRLLLRAGLAHYYRQDVPSAESRLLETIDLAQSCGDQEAWCNAVITLTRLRTTLRPTTLDPSDLGPVEAFLGAVTDQRLRAEALVALSEAQTTSGNLDAARASTELAVSSAVAGGNPAVQAMASFAEGFALLAGNEARQAQRSMRRAVELASRTDDWYLQANLQLRLAFALLGGGDLAEAGELARQAVAAGQAHGEHVVLAVGWGLGAELAWLRGDFDEVERAADRAAAAMRRSGYRLAAFFYLSAQFLSRLATERFDDARALLAANRDLWPLASRLGPVVDAARGEPPPIDRSRRVPTARTQLQAAAVVVASEVACAQGDRIALESLEAELRKLTDQGVAVVDLYPVFVPRVRAGVLRSLGRTDEAADAFGLAANQARAIGSPVEEAVAALGRASMEMVRPEASIHEARAWAVQASDLARRVGLPAVLRRAQAITRLGLHQPEAVAARGGDWRVILVTDVVGSSRVSAVVGDIAYYELIMRHHGVVRRCLDRFGGHEFSESGDGLLAWFDSTDRAAGAALAVFDELAATETPGPRLEVKVGLAGGEPLFHDGRPYGQVVNRAARVVAEARGGQILADEAVAQSLPSGVAPSPGWVVTLRNMGQHELVALSRAEPVP